ncbi:UNVERIFIED_CONTAM: hypothetical protein PYX00_001150 [Menopon gallinae]|uniref:Uncharacterized protein n=1 Tax=Menopon gallinae TaxID=328185 RepID=A0AAW2ICW2_9NEOP
MVDSLRRSFIYVKNHRGAQTLDVALGITLTKGNLRWISATGVGMKYSFEIQQLSDLCDYVFGLLYNVLHKSNSDRERRFSSLLTYHYNEIIAEDLKRGALPTDANFRFPMLENCSSIANFVLTGSPKDSDACILELNESCNVSNTCWDEETNDFEYFGYKTSHRLLYLLLAARCTKRDPCRSQAIQAMKSVLCGRMLGEAVFLEENYLPFTRDLLLEQIALCGFEGHLEFLRNGWAEKILQSQRPEGCFGFCLWREVSRRLALMFLCVLGGTTPF